MRLAALTLTFLAGTLVGAAALSGYWYWLHRSSEVWVATQALQSTDGMVVPAGTELVLETWMPEGFAALQLGINVEGEWVWTSGEPVTYVNWCEGEPTDIAGGAGTEDPVHTIPFWQCWNDDVTWATEFLADQDGNMVPSFPGVIELDHEPGVP